MMIGPGDATFCLSVSFFVGSDEIIPFLKMLPLHTARQSNSLAAVVVPCHKGWHGSPSRLCSFGQKAGFSACVFVCGRVDWRCWPVSAVLAHPSPGPCCSCCYFCCFNPDVFQNPLRLEGRLAGWQHCCLRLSHLLQFFALLLLAFFTFTRHRFSPRRKFSLFTPSGPSLPFTAMDPSLRWSVSFEMEGFSSGFSP